MQIRFDENISADGHNPEYKMLTNETKYRVIYGDTDNMGVAYHANYLRWFEIGRTELIRSWGVTYKEIEARGVFLPVSEAYCKFVTPARYDDVLIIETTLDITLRAGMKFDYRVLNEKFSAALALGYTKHACLNGEGRVVRPPRFLKNMIENNSPKLERELLPES